MSGVFNRAENSKKRRFDDDDEVLLAARFGKKLRLDGAQEETNKDNEVSINPVISSGTPFTYSKPMTSLDDYFARKMMENYTETIKAKGQIIRKYQPQVLVAYQFQKWVTRLFNRFIRKYNRVNHTKIPSFKNFFKIIGVINSSQYNFTYRDLFEIVFKEGELELKAVQDRLSKPKSTLEEIEEESMTFNDVKYNYWDTISSLQEDTEMVSSPTENYTFSDGVVESSESSGEEANGGINMGNLGMEDMGNVTVDDIGNLGMEDMGNVGEEDMDVEMG